VEAFGLGQAGQVLVGLLKIGAVLDQFGTEGTHGGVLLTAIAMRNNDDRSQARAAGGKGDALAVIAARGRGHAGDVRFAATEPVHVDDTAAHFEGSGGSVVLVLDPDLRAGARAQERPADLGSGRHDSVDELGRRLQGSEVREAHSSFLAQRTD